MKACMILTTTDSNKNADSIASKLADLDLAKCIQIDNVTSFYKWDGKLLKKNEFRLMIKACTNNYKLIEQMILNLHDYKLPQIIKVDISDGLDSYLKWLNSK